MKPHLIPDAGAAEPLGTSLVEGGVNIAVFTRFATRIFVCIFDDTDREIARVELKRRQGDVHFGVVGGVGAGVRYGLRADGPYEPEKGFYFDPDKLLVDPYARRIDRAFVHEQRLAARRGESGDTATLVPKGIVVPAPESPGEEEPLKLNTSGLIYELNVRGFSKLHPKVPAHLRGTVAALGQQDVVEYFLKLGVDALELMPVAAFIDERHLPALGLKNAWGYNPVTYFAPDPRLMPGGIDELREVTDIYRAHNIPVILDVVYNHSGESDIEGAVLSMKGLDARAYYRHEEQNGRCRLVNDTGCGNTLRCDFAVVQRLVVESLRYWVEAGGVSGFRFDLAPVLGRGPQGFSPGAELLKAIRNDLVLSKTILIAEPWDPGPGGYQLGQFGRKFAEWNDRYRDDVRGFWRGDPYKLGALATRLAGSQDIFDNSEDRPSRGVNFIAAHDGFTLCDLVTYEERHNLANGENNRDGHEHNLSWNNGVEGVSDDPAIVLARKNDVRALLATLFFSRGLLMLGQGDEMGRTQGGNNNAYAQDNEVTWVDWDGADMALSGFVGELQNFRREHRAISGNRFLNGRSVKGARDVVWLHPEGREMEEGDWNHADASVLGMHLNIEGDEVLVWFNRARQAIVAQNPSPKLGTSWLAGISSALDEVQLTGRQVLLPPRSVLALVPES